MLDKIRSWSAEGRLLYWIRERESIRRKRANGGSPPYTDDPILQQYRFCNVRRMDDKVSQWLYNNWYKPNYNHENMLLACVLARFINEPSTLEVIGFPTVWTPNIIKKKMWDMRRAGQRIFNPAYIIPAGHIKGEGKIDTVIDRVCDPIYRNPPPRVTGDTMKGAVESLKGCYGLSSFMAGQVVADLRWAMSGAWSDRNWWAPIGPGSKKGMNILHGRSLEYRMGQAQFTEELVAVITLCKERLPSSITARLEAMDYQNCLCELSKYDKTLWGRGIPKQRYPGGS